MSTLMLAAILALSAPEAEGPFQRLAGPAFERFAARAERLCAKAQSRFIKPADLDEVESRFLEGLSAGDLARVKAAIPRSIDGGPRSCEGRNGLSCASTHNLKAIERADQLQPFVAFVCAHPAPR